VIENKKLKGEIIMSNLEFIKKALECSIEYWENETKEEPDRAFNRGAVAGLIAFKEKIKAILEKEEENK